jgi:hypothetical protein
MTMMDLCVASIRIASLSRSPCGIALQMELVVVKTRLSSMSCSSCRLKRSNDRDGHSLSRDVRDITMRNWHDSQDCQQRPFAIVFDVDGHWRRRYGSLYDDSTHRGRMMKVPRKKIPRKTHYVRTMPFGVTLLCEPFSGRERPTMRPPATTTSPSQVTCTRCLGKMHQVASASTQEPRHDQH